MNKEEYESGLWKAATEIKKLDVFKRQKIEEIHLAMEPEYERVKSACPHDYKEKLSERIFGYITVYNCGYCQKTLTEQEYELLTQI